ncbi:hypothetical protein F441_00046 [Phytophthora nicotianae CJ01A1]|uniref:Uncharacterized protein n=4 Tax=Phytophthora nicotianae TaxID=4792 RepID=W3AA60_PHYNI|nr:hypothetical protein L915_00046 [Phytophthora nicotianae]ETM03792.1 hypothetical protein L917_00034 [Phytophthora nicotianae]ETO86427.1 hypothetical protein F444_00041 [Phytophthora nicotianae P1976]ETP27425.1 hypothetical protein F441_00046 [Phytophthora nicotianae CJ01A1]ETP55404.1 hypothetical protein F442_00039 [Phytophthora nicotianae P10297]
MAPLINEANDDHGTRAQPFLATMLVLDYGKLANNCLFIAGDNCSVNRRFKTPQRPILRQDTRWGLPYRMAEHYFDSLGFFLGTTTRSRNSCRAPRTVKRLKTLMAELARVKNMSKALQKDDITMLCVG